MNKLADDSIGAFLKALFPEHDIAIFLSFTLLVRMTIRSLSMSVTFRQK
jgi:hypothetical protein